MDLVVSSLCLINMINTCYSPLRSTHHHLSMLTSSQWSFGYNYPHQEPTSNVPTILPPAINWSDTGTKITNLDCIVIIAVNILVP